MRLGDLLEAFRGLGVVGVRVRVVLLGQAPVGLLDLFRRGRVRDTENLIEVPRHGQACPSDEYTCTRAGRTSNPLKRYPAWKVTLTVWSVWPLGTGTAETASCSVGLNG